LSERTGILEEEFASGRDKTPVLLLERNSTENISKNAATKTASGFPYKV